MTFLEHLEDLRKRLFLALRLDLHRRHPGLRLQQGHLPLPGPARLTQFLPEGQTRWPS